MYKIYQLNLLLNYRELQKNIIINIINLNFPLYDTKINEIRKKLIFRPSTGHATYRSTLLADKWGIQNNQTVRTTNSHLRRFCIPKTHQHVNPLHLLHTCILFVFSTGEVSLEDYFEEKK